MTIKQKKFIKEYIETGNGTLAAKKAYNPRNDNVAATIAKENIRKPQIRDAIQQAMIKANLTPDRLARVVDDAMNATKVKELEGDYYVSDVPEHNTRLRAAQLAGNWLGLGKDGGTATNLHLHLHKQAEDLGI